MTQPLNERERKALIAKYEEIVRKPHLRIKKKCI